VVLDDSGHLVDELELFVGPYDAMARIIRAFPASETGL
jgi:hypothetical protein